MRKYNLYKKSTFEWMGEIPSHWILTKNRYGFQKYNNGKNESDETPVLSLTTKGVKVKTNLSFGKSTESYVGHQIVNKGDIVFTPRDFDQTPILSDVSNFYGCISNLYIVDKTKEGVLNHFVNYYWYGLKYSVDYFKNFSHGMRYSFNRFQFDEIPLILPPVSEQEQIVSFLDTKTSLIDSLIEKTRRKIELLKEKKTSLINEVVTKGLNPNVEIKDSGVEWIKEIPSHWMVSKLKYDSSTPVQYGINISGDKYVEEGIRFIRITDIRESGDLNPNDGKYLVPGDVPNEFLLQKFDILFCRSGHTVGKSYLHTSDGLFSSGGYLVRFNFRNYTESKFIFYLSKTHFYWDWININTVVSTIENVNGDKYQNFIYPKPPLSEQNEIVSYLDEQTQLIDKTISIEEKRIELLREYRQSLISEVVTGKIDVRVN